MAFDVGVPFTKSGGSGPYQNPPPRSHSIILSLLSSAYIIQARVSCLSLDLQKAHVAFNLALDKAGNSMAARMAMMAITTSSSIRVKPSRRVSFLSGTHPVTLFIFRWTFMLLQFSGWL